MRLDPGFLALSARCGRDPLRIQGPGGNSSIKSGDRMWIKASGTELADAETREIFVEVDLAAARAEADGAGDGSCRAAVVDPGATLRPSIETTFHAVPDWPVVVHTHSVAALVHAVSPEGRAAARGKLAGLDAELVPYEKPGLPLTLEIRRRVRGRERVILLENHGLIVAGRTAAEVSDLMEDVESRLGMPVLGATPDPPRVPAPAGRVWAADATLLGTDPRLAGMARTGSYYPDHVVFLGPGLAPPADGNAPAVLVPGAGVGIRRDATPAQRAMVRCLADVLTRLPADWTAEPIGSAAEAELLDWDAERYRQMLAGRGTGAGARR